MCEDNKWEEQNKNKNVMGFRKHSTGSSLGILDLRTGNACVRADRRLAEEETLTRPPPKT